MLKPQQVDVKRIVVDGQECTVRVFEAREAVGVEHETLPHAKQRGGRWNRNSEFNQITRFARDIGSYVE